GAGCNGHQGRDGVLMSQFVFKMPDLGEGTVEAEIVAWHTAPGAVVTEDQVIVEVMTDKAAVEVPAPVSGRVVSISGAPGDKVAVGSPLIVFELSAGSTAAAAVASPAAAAPPPPTPTPGARTCGGSASRCQGRSTGACAGCEAGASEPDPNGEPEN